MDIKVLGTGCANCKNTIALIEQVARDKGVEISLEKVEDIRRDHVPTASVDPRRGARREGRARGRRAARASKVESWF